MLLPIKYKLENGYMVVGNGFHEKANAKYVKIVETEERNYGKKLIAQIILKI